MSIIPQEEEQWITVEDARQQTHDYVLSFLPEEPDEDGDCETCRVIKQIAAGLRGAPDGGDQPETSGD